MVNLEGSNFGSLDQDTLSTMRRVAWPDSPRPLTPNDSVLHVGDYEDEELQRAIQLSLMDQQATWGNSLKDSGDDFKLMLPVGSAEAKPRGDNDPYDGTFGSNSAPDPFDSSE